MERWSRLNSDHALLRVKQVISSALPAHIVIDDNSRLLDLEDLDSLALEEILENLEQQLSIRIPAGLVVPGNLETPIALAALVVRLSHGTDND